MTDHETEMLENLKVAKNYNTALFELLANHTKDGRMLDFGAGLGTFAGRFPCPPDCLEVDPDRTIKLESRGYKVVTSVEKNYYDFIYSLNVLEHIEKDQEVAHQLVSGLRPKGTLFLFVPAFPFLFSKFDKKFGHIRRYTRASLMKTFEHPDLEILESRYFDTIGFFLAAIHKFARLDNKPVTRKTILTFDRFLFPLNRLLDPLFSSMLGKNVLLLARKK